MCVRCPACLRRRLGRSLLEANPGIEAAGNRYGRAQLSRNTLIHPLELTKGTLHRSEGARYFLVMHCASGFSRIHVRHQRDATPVLRCCTCRLAPRWVLKLETCRQLQPQFPHPRKQSAALVDGFFGPCDPTREVFEFHRLQLPRLSFRQSNA